MKEFVLKTSYMQTTLAWFQKPEKTDIREKSIIFTREDIYLWQQLVNILKDLTKGHVTFSEGIMLSIDLQDYENISFKFIKFNASDGFELTKTEKIIKYVEI